MKIHFKEEIVNERIYYNDGFLLWFIQWVYRKNDIPYVPLTCSVEGKEYIDNFGQSLPYKEFYEAMIKGEIPKTSQPSPEAYYKVFKDLIDKDKDILYVCVSSGLSGTYNSANIAKNMILDEFRNARIEIVDVLTASLGQGIMVIKAMDMKKMD